MASRLGIVGLIALLAALVGGAPAAPASREGTAVAPAYYVARADPRLCPSPMCGGIWVDRVNTDRTVCGDGARQEECYAAAADLRQIRVDGKGRVLLQRLVTEGRAVVRGKLVRGLVEGFPELDTLVVSEVWAASSSLARARGTFFRLRDNGVRCVTTPCHSVRAARLNAGGHVDVSDLDLSRSGASPLERRRALDTLATTGLVVAGHIVRDGPGRTAVAYQFYVRATP